MALSYSEKRRRTAKNERLRAERRERLGIEGGASPKTFRRVTGGKRKRWDAVIDRIGLEKDTVGAEVGVWNGDTAERILAQRPKVRLFLVDRWEPPEPGDSYFNSGAKIAAQSENMHQKAYQRCRMRTEPYKERIEWLVGASLEMAEAVAERSLDFVFVDADHSFEGVYNDILAWLPKIAVGGWIGGHNWNAKWPVEEAVTAILDKKTVTKDANSTWFHTVTEEDHDLVKDIVAEIEAAKNEAMEGVDEEDGVEASNESGSNEDAPDETFESESASESGGSSEEDSDRGESSFGEGSDGTIESDDRVSSDSMPETPDDSE